MTHGMRIVAQYIMVPCIALTGCLGPRRDSYQSSQTLVTGQDSAQIDLMWEAIKDVLREHQLRLDRVDRREGVITTMPATSQHFFEFWRRDLDTTPDFWESTLNPLRRWVEVHLSQTEDSGRIKVEVTVHKQRFSAPDRQFNNSGLAYQFFGFRLPATTGQERITPEHEQWLDVGRDHAMEAYFLRNMLQRAPVTWEAEVPAK